ncbi:MAG: F0F1 ATP synthase subunit B [Fermentimonas sp.]|nr:F0F1 ATP synthase subunit B [Fermentimonas sp.]MDD4696018.1 F0F1 ATP synthase subunit B [Fermentimonas sp.]
MSLLTPDPGLVIWMTISFGIVVLILAKFAFPSILKAVDKRTSYIEGSLKSAREANEELAKVKETRARILAEAHKEQNAILKETARIKEEILQEAHVKASQETENMIAEARKQIHAEKDQVLRSIRSEVTIMSVSLAEKILREKLGNDKEQLNMIDRLLDEIEISKS